MLRRLGVATFAWLVVGILRASLPFGCTFFIQAIAVPPAWAETLQGRVVSVHDGDTLQVEVPGGRREKIRLVGIDSPEISQAPWGARARDFTRGLALDKDVRVETDVQPRDRYGRLLGYVYVGATFVNLEVIRSGHAVLLTYPPNVKHVEAFTAAQTEARARGRGLWDPKQPLGETPYEFRHKNDGKPRFKRGEGMKVASPDARSPRRHAQPAAQDAPDGMVRFNRRSKKIHPAGCGHACPSCVPMTRDEAEQRGGVVCKHH